MFPLARDHDPCGRALDAALDEGRIRRVSGRTYGPADLAFAEDLCRRAAVARELTKLHEEVRRGPLLELLQWAEQPVRGRRVSDVQGVLWVDRATAAPIARCYR